MSGNEKEKWSQRVTESSDALDLEREVFTWDDPTKIARSLKRSADASRRRRGTSFQSAMSMLTFYVNRAGSRLPDDRRRVLEQAKEELRVLYGRRRAGVRRARDRSQLADGAQGARAGSTRPGISSVREGGDEGAHDEPR